MISEIIRLPEPQKVQYMLFNIKNLVYTTTHKNRKKIFLVIQLLLYWQIRFALTLLLMWRRIPSLRLKQYLWSQVTKAKAFWKNTSLYLLELMSCTLKHEGQCMYISYHREILHTDTTPRLCATHNTKGWGKIHIYKHFHSCIFWDLNSRLSAHCKTDT